LHEDARTCLLAAFKALGPKKESDIFHLAMFDAVLADASG
jgi:hypothetical protein